MAHDTRAANAKAYPEVVVTNGNHEHFDDLHEERPDMESRQRTPNRLILCLDGTGNSFQANTSDTNIVKMYDMMDHNHPHQMHYYQPGIGTYPTEGSVNVSKLGGFSRKLHLVVDQMLATSFDAHVIAAYRFIMRYYNTGDRIYIFGFSRGAFTARFLARMISHVGLLSLGNEEMVPFAYKVYQDYEMDKPKATEYMRLFKKCFCRNEREAAALKGLISENESGIKAHFLGLFDCVNSVGTLDLPWGKKHPLPKVRGTAEHIRHAVATDERRVKFKPSLFAQEDVDPKKKEDITEVWFPGNHGDIGGGWPAEIAADADPKLKLKVKKETGQPTEDKKDDAFQLSDIALKWMIDEIDSLETDRVAWNPEAKADFLGRFAKRREQMIQARLHDTMSFGGGSRWYMALIWKAIEYLPFVKRWELCAVKNKPEEWRYVSFPLNKGARRDIPAGALLHYSILNRMRTFPNYRPSNEIWVAHGEHDTMKRLSDLNTESVDHSQRRGPNDMYLVHQADRTLGSISVGEDDDFEHGPVKDDRVYTVALGPSSSK